MAFSIGDDMLSFFTEWIEGAEIGQRNTHARYLVENKGYLDNIEHGHATRNICLPLTIDNTILLLPFIETEIQ